MYIFGGFEEKHQRFSQETYVFNFDTQVWQRLKTEVFFRTRFDLKKFIFLFFLKGALPPHRDFHAACVLNEHMYIFGGRSDVQGQYHSDQDFYCGKLYALNLTTNEWTQVKTFDEGPTGRRSHSICKCYLHM